MSEPLNFRSAFNGFNREDVVYYIEYLNANHDNQIKQLRAELAAMQKETLPPADKCQDNAVSEMQEQFAQQEAVLTALNAEKDDLIARCAQLEATLASLTAENKALSDKAANLEAQIAAGCNGTPSIKPQLSSYMEEELAAYRRAERVERLANQRANAIYRKLRTALQETAAQTDEAAATLESVTGQFSAQFDVLRTYLSDSKACLEQSLGSLDDIFPDPIEE